MVGRGGRRAQRKKEGYSFLQPDMYKMPFVGEKPASKPTVASTNAVASRTPHHADPTARGDSSIQRVALLRSSTDDINAVMRNRDILMVDAHLNSSDASLRDVDELGAHLDRAGIPGQVNNSLSGYSQNAVDSFPGSQSPPTSMGLPTGISLNSSVDWQNPGDSAWVQALINQSRTGEYWPQSQRQPTNLLESYTMGYQTGLNLERIGILGSQGIFGGNGAVSAPQGRYRLENLAPQGTQGVSVGVTPLPERQLTRENFLHQNPLPEMSTLESNSVSATEGSLNRYSFGNSNTPSNVNDSARTDFQHFSSFTATARLDQAEHHESEEIGGETKTVTTPLASSDLTSRIQLERTQAMVDAALARHLNIRNQLKKPPPSGG